MDEHLQKGTIGIDLLDPKSREFHTSFFSNLRGVLERKRLKR